MAKLVWEAIRYDSDWSLTVGGKRPSFSGLVYVTQDNFGRPSVRSWPRPGGNRPVHERVLAARQFIKYSAYIYKITDPYFTDQYRKQSISWWLMPRDVFTAALAGRLWWFTAPDGRKIYSRSAKRDMSESLDILWQDVGGLLVRGATGWEGLPVGNVGQVLVVGAAGRPSWVDPSRVQAGVGRIWLDGNRLYSPSNGTGSVYLNNRVLAIRMTGVATSEIAFSVFSPSDEVDCSISFFCGREGSDGGSYSLEVRVYEVFSNGDLGVPFTWSGVVDAPGVGGNTVIAPSSFHLQENPSRRAIHVRLFRYGASPLDTNGSNLCVWGVNVAYV